MPIYTLTMSHRPTRDLEILTYSHVPFYLALEMNSDAWAKTFDETADGLLTPAEMAVVHVDSDFRVELFTGEADFDVQLTRIGVSTLTWQVEIFQGGKSAATVTTILSRVNGKRTHSIPLTDEQRAAFEPLLNAYVA
jgi:acyl-CoA thioesterase FadM